MLIGQQQPIASMDAENIMLIDWPTVYELCNVSLYHTLPLQNLKGLSVSENKQLKTKGLSVDALFYD
jgi:hypothetical protein